MNKLIAYLRERGTQELVGECLLENARLATLARHAGFEIKPEAEGTLWLHLALH